MCFTINFSCWYDDLNIFTPVSYTHLRAHETLMNLVCRLLLEKKLFLMIRRPPRSTRKESSAASDVYKRQAEEAPAAEAPAAEAPAAEAPACLLYTSPSPRDAHESRMPSSA